jgi:hypothetical protein
MLIDDEPLPAEFPEHVAEAEHPRHVRARRIGQNEGANAATWAAIAILIVLSLLVAAQVTLPQPFPGGGS